MTKIWPEPKCARQSASPVTFGWLGGCAPADDGAGWPGGPSRRPGRLSELLAAQPGRISFDLPDAVTAGELPSISGELSAEALAERRVEVSTDLLQRDLTALLAWAGERGVELTRLCAEHGSLDELFHSVQRGGELAAAGFAMSEGGL